MQRYQEDAWDLSEHEIVYHTLGIQLGDLGDLCDISSWLMR